MSWWIGESVGQWVSGSVGGLVSWLVGWLLFSAVPGTGPSKNSTSDIHPRASALPFFCFPCGGDAS